MQYFPKWGFFVVVIALVGIILTTLYLVDLVPKQSDEQVHKAHPKPPKKLAKKQRADYWFYRLRDPKTNEIPAGIRHAEMLYARLLPKKEYNNARIEGENPFAWKEIGPYDVGGRTRALAQDRRNPDIIIAGGTSGGVWKSDNGGASWTPKTPNTHNLSITSLVQNPNMPDEWFYSMGELVGNSAGDRGFKAPYAGSGLFRSADNGESWNYLQYEATEFPTNWQKVENPATSFTNNNTNAFNFTLRIAISPTSSSIFVASNNYGILRSDDAGETFELILGAQQRAEVGRFRFSDISIASDGKLIAALSGKKQDGAGIFISENNGNTWENITPSDFPETHERTLLAHAPSNPMAAYSLTHTGNSTRRDDSPYRIDDVRFFKYNLANNTAEDRSANLPDYGNVGVFATQGNYNMVLEVKPDDEDFVLVGGINLFRSDNGFATRARTSDPNLHWIGGFHNDNRGGYGNDNHHPDQQGLWFDVENPDILISATDGGLSRTTVTDAGIVWESLNNGYNVTQFYTVAIANWTDFVMGGTQDRGTPLLGFASNQTQLSPQIFDLTRADGAYCAFDRNKPLIYASSQNGFMGRFKIQGNSIVWSYIYPSEAQDQNFINPFILDPADNNKMYYLGGNTIWRQDNLAVLPDYINGTMQGWQQAVSLNLNSRNYFISAISASEKNPAQRLYFAASSYRNFRPILYRLDNAHSARNSRGREIPLPNDIPNGAFISAIAINPQNADEILIALSNYNIVSLYHSADGGDTFTAVEGNLAGNESLPGPSVRHALIHTHKGKTTYLVGTSIGVFSTEILDANATEWVQEGTAELGNAVVTMLEARPKDGTLAVSTHGRGIFIGFAEQAFFDGLEEPLELIAKNPTKMGFTLEWSEVEDATSYEVQVSTTPNFTQIVNDFNPRSVSQNRLIIEDELLPNTQYFARVKAMNNTRNSFYSHSVEIRTLADNEAVTGLVDMSKMPGLSLYPNPTSGNLKLRLPAPLATQEWQLRMTDSKGAIIFEQKATVEYINEELRQQVPYLPNGLYILHLQNAEHKGSLKFIKE
ncbi:MAG: T9SS type A sorting domain-containing protein [Bernardetiaceae bacterium]|nr:T9SS type A sorting domain-containing protein [Bernardetiaceae bacterium]